MYTEQDYFEPSPEQRTLYQEGVCLPGWVGGLPEAPAQPLYVPKEQASARRAAKSAHARWFNES